MTWLIQADDFGLEELRASALEFLAEKIGEVCSRDDSEEGDGSLSLLEEKPSLLMEVMRACARLNFGR